jgi:hypothetical protein
MQRHRQLFMVAAQVGCGMFHAVASGSVVAAPDWLQRWCNVHRGGVDVDATVTRLIEILKFWH